MANYPIYRLVKGTTLTFAEMDGNLEWLSRTMSASVVEITGSTFVEGNLTVSNGITGSLFGTASWSENSTSASYAYTASSAVSSSYAYTASSAVSASYTISSSYAYTASSAVSSSYSLTASSADDFVVRGSLTASAALITGTITAQTLVVQIITSSIIYSSGSNIFGNLITDKQTLTGSVNITGSLNVIGNTTANSFIKSDGTSTQFLKADGTVDSNTYYSTSNPSSYISLTSLSSGTGINYNNLTGVIANSAPDQTVSLTQGGTTVITGTYPNFTITSNDQYTGTVTSVGGTGTVSGLSLSGTVTGTGNLTLGGTLSVLPSNFASQTANTVLAAPNGSAGTPSFRALVAADIPALTYQAQLNGTGFVKATGTAISYDNSTYYLASNPNGYTTNTGTVTSVNGTGTVSGLTLTGTVSTTGNLTLGGTLSLTSANVTDALTYTPYNATNPDGYVSNAADTYTGTPKITNIVTLTSAEYAGIGSPSTSTLYIII